MKKVTNIDLEVKCKKFSTALNRFMKKYPGHEEWIEAFEYMYENNVDCYNDFTMGDGTYNTFWAWCLHLDVFEDSYYMAIIERR